MRIHARNKPSGAGLHTFISVKGNCSTLSIKQ